MSRESKTANLDVQPDFNGAAIIDDQGNEIAITEAMVQQAIRALDGQADTGRKMSSGQGETDFAGD